MIDIKNWLTQIKKGYLELCILGIISNEKKAYGFQLISNLKSIDIEVKDGTLYPLLSRLTRDGYLQARWDLESSDGSRPRKFYSLTKQGEEALTHMKKEFEVLHKNYRSIVTNTVSGDTDG